MPEQLGLAGSTLPTFERADGDGEWWLDAYRCTRCDKRWYVRSDEPLEAPTAPCPHCFKVSQVPA